MACAFPTAFAHFPNLPAMGVPTATHVYRHRKAPIDSLPAELLVAIFRKVIQTSELEEWNSSTLAFVCSHWRWVAFLTPEFWTRITIFIDLPFFSTSSITAAFARSCDLNLEDVIVTRKTSTTNDERERERVMSIMQIINPNIHRCRTISFNVLFSSSLPSFPVDFHGPAPLLKSLELKCVEDDGGAPSDVGDTNLSAMPQEPLQCPDLRELAIDGRNYFKACQRSLHWAKMFPAVSTLSISHFTPIPTRSESFPSSELLFSLLPFQHHLETLSINDVHLDKPKAPLPDEYDEFELDYFEFDLQRIVFENMHSIRSMGDILGFLGCPPVLHITRCPLKPFEGETSLKEIDGDGDIAELLTGCLSQKIVIDGCPGFGEEVLHAMMSPGPDRDPTLPSCGPYVQDLSIVNCPDFSISTLKKVVETRRLQAIRLNPFAHHMLPCIRALRLSGDVPDVSLEDREWFKGHLSEFSYDPTQ